MPLNDSLPWEMEALLSESGWHIVDQRPRLARTVRGQGSQSTEESITLLPDLVLQQTVATSWEFLAELG